MGAFFFSDDAQASLYGLGMRCLHEPASRRLDGEIYCAIHNVTDWNPLLDNQQFQARESGEVLVEHRAGEGFHWIEAPPFTTELRYAESLLPEGILTFYREARRVCATALQARALANEPAPPVSNIAQLRKV